MKVVDELYASYVAQVGKEKKIEDVKQLVKKLIDEEVLIERIERENIEWNEDDEEAKAWEAAVTGKGVYTSGFTEDVNDKLIELAAWAGLKISLRISTKRDFEKSDEETQTWQTAKERLMKAGFEVSTYTDEEAEKTEWIEARKVLAENDTAEAVLEVVELRNFYDC